MIKLLTVSIATIQILDVLVHATTNQLEVLRVCSNGIILAWLIYLSLNKANKKSWPYSYIPTGIYLLLNILFLDRAGLINTSSGEPRIALVLFVLATAILSAILIVLTNQSKHAAN